MDLKVREGFPVPTPRQDFSYLPDAGVWPEALSVWGPKAFVLRSVSCMVFAVCFIGSHFGPSRFLPRLVTQPVCVLS